MKTIYKKIGMTATKRILAYILFICFAVSGATAQFNALDYRLQKRPKLEKFDSDNFFDNTFVSGSFGVQFNTTGNKADRDIGPVARYYFGKWFTPVIGARFGIDMSILCNKGTSTHALFGFNLDYMANLSAFVAGYDPDRLFDLYGFAGATYKRSFRYGYGTNVFGGSFGLQGNFNINRLISLYVEPRITIANDGYNERYVERKFDILPEVSVGLAYKMQPLPRTYMADVEKTKFKENIFFSFGVGVQRPLSNMSPIYTSNIKLGPAGMIAVGGWFKNVHGIRLSAYGGYSDYTGENIAPDNKLGSAILRADYMINYSNVFGGYDESRIFEMIGTFGPELAFSGQTGTKWKMSAGLGVGLQGNFRINPALDIFVEPRISFYTTNYTNGDNNRYDSNASLLLGLTYHSIDREYKKENDEFEKKSVVDRMFVSLSGGAGATFSRIKEDLHGGKNLAGKVTIGLGTWFTPVSGLQITGGTLLYGTNYSYGSYYRARTLLLGVDYLFNMTNAVRGYKEDRLFELIAAGGIGAMYNHSVFHPVLQAEMKAKFNLKKNWSIFVAPQALWAMQRGVLTGSVATRKSVILTGNIGTSYSMRGYDPVSLYAFKEGEGSRMFFSVAGGFGGIIDNGMFSNLKEKISPSGRLSLGNWVTPLAGWRLSVMSERIKQTRTEAYITHGGIGGEFMLNLTNAAIGYNPDRFFNIYAMAGVHAGFSIVEHNMRFIPGFTGSVQASFRVAPSFSLFVEPQLAIYLNKFDGTNRQKSIGTIYAGLTYSINKSDKFARDTDARLDKPNFLSVSGGVGLWGNTLMSSFGGFKDKMVYSASIAYGRWITPVHGLRLNADYTNIVKPYQTVGEKINTVAGRADYMLNLTNLLAGNNDNRLFEAIAFVGAGAVVPLKNGDDNRDLKTTYTAAFGIQAKFNVSDRFDVFIEPKGTFYGDGIDGYSSRAKFDATASVLAGFNCKF